MKAMIFAAGLGSRLQPLTNQKPKALVDLCGKPLLQHVIECVYQAGFHDLVVNVHHFADQIEQFLDSNNNFGLNITVSDERDLLRDTGGGLHHAASLLNDGEPILLHNVDVYSDIDLKALYRRHQKTQPLASLAVRKCETDRALLFDERACLRAWHHRQTGQIKPPAADITGLLPYTFSGIHVVSPEIFELITERGVFSIIDTYLRLANKHTIKAFDHTGDLWHDIGTPQRHAQLTEMLNINSFYS